MVAGKTFEDRELVEEARRGSSAAFRTLVERYQHRVLMVAQSVIGRYEDAEDIVQEAFLKAYRNLSSFKGESSFYTWLYRIVFNLAIDERRKRFRHVEASTGDMQALSGVFEKGQAGDAAPFIAKASNPENEFENSELRQQLRDAISSLSPVHRTAIVLREVDGLSYAEISDVMGCSKGTVMSRLHHARRRLQLALRDTHGADTDGATQMESEVEDGRKKVRKEAIVSGRIEGSDDL